MSTSARIDLTLYHFGTRVYGIDDSVPEILVDRCNEKDWARFCHEVNRLFRPVNFIRGAMKLCILLALISVILREQEPRLARRRSVEMRAPRSKSDVDKKERPDPTLRAEAAALK